VGPAPNKPAVAPTDKAAQETQAQFNKLLTSSEKMVNLMATNNIQNDAAMKALKAGDAKTGAMLLVKTFREQGMTTEAISQLFSQTINQ
jgi:hypothetical protein